MLSLRQTCAIKRRYCESMKSLKGLDLTIFSTSIFVYTKEKLVSLSFSAGFLRKPPFIIRRRKPNQHDSNICICFSEGLQLCVAYVSLERTQASRNFLRIDNLMSWSRRMLLSSLNLAVALAILSPVKSSSPLKILCPK